jgi:1-acyl-sn-glycerol-3-phosphate acyltransferase
MASPSIAGAEAPSSRLRAYGRIVGLGLWFLICIVPHLLTGLAGRSRWPRRFMRGAAAICGAKVCCEGHPATRGTLLVANHASWLDIPVLAAATGCAFVAKAELTGNPFMRWFANQNATLYVDRADRRSIHGQTAALAAALTGDKPIALFPEGTVGDGGRLLPFKPSLLAAVAPPPEGTLIRPAAIDYGTFATRIGWGTGEAGVANFMRVLGRKGRLPVTVRLLPALAPSADRKVLARTAHDAIAAALAPSGIRPAGV